MLDDYNRADGGLGANYTTPSGYNGMEVSSNRLKSSAEIDSAAIWNTSYAADQQVAIKAPVLFEAGHLLRICVRLQSATGFGECYYVEFERGASDAKVRFYYYSGTVATQLGNELNLGIFMDNDQFGVRVSGSTLSAWINGTQVASVMDSTLNAAGRFLINIPATSVTRLDDLCGGAL